MHETKWKYLSYLHFLHRYEKLCEEDRAALKPHLERLRENWMDSIDKYKHKKIPHYPPSL